MTHAGRVLCATALLVACAGAGCATRRPAASGPAASRSAVSLSPAAVLQRAVTRIVSEPGLGRGTWGVSVVSLTRHDTLVSLNDDRLLLPSSTMKVVTLATAAARLGWDFTFETRLVAAGRIAGGTLEGDLVVIGTGDPSLDDWDGSATRLFQDWARRLKEAGITAVKGRLVGDATAFDGETIGAGWAWDDLDRSFAAEVSALQFNENSAQIRVTPAAAPGAETAYTLTPGYAGLTVRSDLQTGAADAVPAFTTRRQTGDGTIELRGTIPLGGPSFVRNVSVPHPPRYFLAALRHVLTESGVEILGPTVEADAPTAPPPDGALVLSYRSPPLAVLAQTMMKLSQNLYAETLLKTLGRTSVSAAVDTAASAPASSRAVSDERPASWQAGLAAVKAMLDSWGIADGSIVQADGSGLSRYNYATAAAMVAVLGHVQGDPALSTPFQAALPIAGRDGTLERRLRGTSAEGRVIAKTGSMSNARALAGYATAANGEVLAFAVMANNFGGPAEPVDRAIDAIVGELALFSR